MTLARRDLMKGLVSTGLLASLAGCATQPSGSGLHGLDQNQRSILREGTWTSGNADIGNTRVNDTGTARAGISTTNWSESVVRSVDDASGKVFEPVVDGRGNVYIAGPDAAVHCHDFESGQKKWSVDLPEKPAGSPSFDDMESGFTSNEMLYVTTVDGFVVGISPGAGESVFETDVGTACSTGPTAVGGACYMYTDDPGKLVAVDSSGDIAWEVGDFSESPTYPPALGDDLIYVQSDRGVIGVAPDSQADDPKVAVVISDTARSPPVVQGETVYFAGGRGGIHAYEIDVPSSAFSQFGGGIGGVDENNNENGSEEDREGDDVVAEHLFRAELLSPSTGEIAVDSQHVYTVLDNGEIEAVSNQDGEYAWRASPQGDEQFHSVSVSGTVLYATATNGGLYVISTINGDVLNRYSVESPFESNVSVAGESLLVSTEREVGDIVARDGIGDSQSEGDSDDDGDSGDSDSDSEESWGEGESVQQLLSMQTELTADPLQPRFEQSIARAQAVDHLSASKDAVMTSQLQAEELTRHLTGQFESGVEDGEVSITDADAAMQKLRASMAVSGEFMLTFSNEYNWPNPEQVDGMDIPADNGLPVNRARSEGVGFEICRAVTVLPFQLLLAFSGPLLSTMRFVRGTRAGSSASGIVARAVNSVTSWLKNNRGVKMLKEQLGASTPIGVWAIRKLMVPVNFIRKLITEGSRAARRSIENTNRLQQSEKDILLENFAGRSAIGNFTTDTAEGFIADYSGLNDLATALFDGFGEILNSKLQSIIESNALDEIDAEDNMEDTGVLDRRVEHYIQDMTSGERYEEAARGNVETDQVVIRQELADVVHEYEQTAIGYQRLRAAVDNWDSVYGLPEDIVDLTQALYSDHDSWRDRLQAGRIILSAGWSYLKGFIEWIEGALNIGFGITAVYKLMRSHGNGVSRIQSL